MRKLFNYKTNSYMSWEDVEAGDKLRIEARDRKDHLYPYLNVLASSKPFKKDGVWSFWCHYK